MLFSSHFHPYDTLSIMHVFKCPPFRIGCTAPAETRVIICTACPEQLASRSLSCPEAALFLCVQAAAAACRSWAAELWTLLKKPAHLLIVQLPLQD